MDSDWLLKTKQKTKWGNPSWKWCLSALVSFRKEPWLRLKTCASPRFMIGCLRWRRIVYDILTPNNIESLWWKYNSVPENSASKLFSSNNNVLIYYSILSRILEGELEHLRSAALFIRGPKLPPPILYPVQCACVPLTQLPMLPLPLDQTNKRTQQQSQPLSAQKNQDWTLWKCELVTLILKDTLSPVS